MNQTLKDKLMIVIRIHHMDLKVWYSGIRLVQEIQHLVTCLTLLTGAEISAHHYATFTILIVDQLRYMEAKIPEFHNAE